MKSISVWFGSGLLVIGLCMAQGHPAWAAEPQTLDTSKFNQVAKLMVDKCFACHTSDFELPFYAQIPGIKGIIEKDYTDGLRSMNLNEEFAVAAKGKPVSEVAIAKIEWVTKNDTMPPAKFTAVHWGSRITRKDRDLILSWVKNTRAKHYAVASISPKLANEPLQPLPNITVQPAKVALGEQLFNDTRLSGDNTLSCASCHELAKAGTDNSRFATGVRGQKGDINAPTVFNAIFNVQQFWNGRAADLQEQAGGPPFNPVEMDSKDWKEIIAKLEQDAPLSAAMRAVYPEGWTGDNITDAIAEYEKTLITPNSRFDAWLTGRSKALTPQEIEGYQRFKAYRCASCHVGKSIGGQSFEYVDLKQNYFADRGTHLASDEGLKAFTNKPRDLHKFKVPNLRNIELTAPYMHDGTLTTLDQTITVMGTYLSGLAIPDNDRALIKGFLRTLTGEFNGKPLTGTVAP